MNYNSTRDSAIKISSAQAIKTGLSTDGGLFVPEHFPTVSLSEIESMRDMTYSQRAVSILGRFLTDYTNDEITSCVSSAYSADKWGDSDITPLHKLNGGEYVLELWHGVTCAFKDVALQILPHLLTLAIKKTNDKRTACILVATSGDTGKAALEGFKDVPGTTICVFYPSDGVSDIQKLQMTSQDGANVAVCGINGNFDDAQTGVKKIFTDERINAIIADKNMMFSSANSINWGRLVPQIVYYFSAYCDLLKKGDITAEEKINFVVPTGNFGNILAGIYAKTMGLPINKLICASNQNNILTDFINTGVYDKNRQFYTTASPSMDILISSNLERFIYDVCDKDDVKLKDFMQQLSSSGCYIVDDDTVGKIKGVLYGDHCDDNATAATIKDVFDKYGYTMDPHTAVGKNVYDGYKKATDDDTKTVILSTASPFKFNEFVIEALTGEAPSGNEFELLEELSTLTGLKIPSSLAALKGKDKRFCDVIDRDEILEYVVDTAI